MGARRVGHPVGAFLFQRPPWPRGRVDLFTFDTPCDSGCHQPCLTDKGRFERVVSGRQGLGQGSGEGAGVGVPVLCVSFGVVGLGTHVAGVRETWGRRQLGTCYPEPVAAKACPAVSPGGCPSAPRGPAWWTISFLHFLAYFQATEGLAGL